jgi:cold-inducible RNA-binding protein
MKLYVGNLAFSVKGEELKSLFAQFGAVKSANVIMDRDSGRSKGFGFVEMETSEDANTAISQLDGKEAFGRNIRVSEAKEREPRTGGGNRGGDRGPRRNFNRGGSRDME